MDVSPAIDSRLLSQSPASPLPRSEAERPDGLDLERVLRRIGGWGKRIAFVGQVNQMLGKLSPPKAVGLYTLATFYSVWKILHDKQEPYGSRAYIANLAGCDTSIGLLRHHTPEGGGGAKYVPWDEVPTRCFVDGSAFKKAIQAGIYTVYRNRFTLGFFWALSLSRRLSTFAMARARGKKGVPFLATLFPRGVASFGVGCARTAGLLFTYSFMFWSLIGMSHFARIGKGMNGALATLLITMSAIVALPVEDVKRWQPCAAFMSMAILD